MEVKTLPSGGEIELSVTPAAHRPPGWFSSPVHLFLHDDQGQPRGTLPLEIRGEVIPPFHYYPRAIALGAVRVGSQVQAQVVVDATGGTLLDASAMAHGMHLETSRKDANYVTVTVSFAAVSIGPQHTAIHLIYQSNDGEISTVEVPIWYTVYASETIVQSAPWRER